MWSLSGRRGDSDRSPPDKVWPFDLFSLLDYLYPRPWRAAICSSKRYVKGRETPWTNTDSENVRLGWMIDEVSAFCPVRCDLQPTPPLLLRQYVQMHFIISTVTCLSVSGCCGDSKKKKRCILAVFTYTPPTMHHHGHQVIEPLRVGGVPRGVEEAELQREDDTIGQLGVALQLLHVFKALQVQSQDHRQLLYTHPTSQISLSDNLRAKISSTHTHKNHTIRQKLYTDLLCASCLLLHSSQ